MGRCITDPVSPISSGGNNFDLIMAVPRAHFLGYDNGGPRGLGLVFGETWGQEGIPHDTQSYDCPPVAKPNPLQTESSSNDTKVQSPVGAIVKFGDNDRTWRFPNDWPRTHRTHIIKRYLKQGVGEKKIPAAIEAEGGGLPVTQTTLVIWTPPVTGWLKNTAKGGGGAREGGEMGEGGDWNRGSSPARKAPSNQAENCANAANDVTRGLISQLRPSGDRNEHFNYSFQRFTLPPPPFPSLCLQDFPSLYPLPPRFHFATVPLRVLIL
ncbi:hypothetical protein CDAR_240491 [Caerostris darwini]|uniref:Uncharacterized protein n=1 Tax=Caerostris darwini TaxID=1538125 RepID=A0AAV4PTC3_9ARAC|nr:hypothetical protein CDAR_240491 [Caerostris darwini]